MDNEKKSINAKTLLSFLQLEWMRKHRSPLKKKAKGIKRSKAENALKAKHEKKEKKLHKIAAKSQKINRGR